MSTKRRNRTRQARIGVSQQADPRQLFLPYVRWFKGSVDRPGFAGGEARSAEGAKPPGSCPAGARICGSADDQEVVS
jgi:hypothetical protein